MHKYRIIKVKYHTNEVSLARFYLLNPSLGLGTCTKWIWNRAGLHYSLVDMEPCWFTYSLVNPIFSYSWLGHKWNVLTYTTKFNFLSVFVKFGPRVIGKTLIDKMCIVYVLVYSTRRERNHTKIQGVPRNMTVDK